MQKIIDKHSEIVQRVKVSGRKQIPGIFVILDDIADNSGAIHRQGNSVINRLYLSGRHMGISTILATQDEPDIKRDSDAGYWHHYFSCEISIRIRRHTTYV